MSRQTAVVGALCDHLASAGFKTVNGKRNVATLWRNASVVIVVGNWRFKTVNGKRNVATAHLAGGVLMRFIRRFWKEISNAPISAEVLEKFCHVNLIKVLSLLI